MNTIEKALQKNKALKSQQSDENLGSQVDKKSAAESLSTIEASQHKSQTAHSSVETETNVTKSKSTVDAVKSDAAKHLTLTLDAEDGFVTNNDRRVINEEFRSIKRKVLNNAFGPLSQSLNNSNIIMVTSPNPNEGKTFTAVNLALSIALEKDKTVLLVDADVLRPSVMKTLNQSFEHGLMEYLLGEVDDLSEVIHQTSLETLRIIPAGKSHHLSSELLASEKMLETVNEFANRYPDRVVIFDAPPLLGINETAILANLAGQAMIVVDEGKTSLTRLSKAVEQLAPDMAKGFVINKSTQRYQDGAGYYGYYYGSS